MRGFQELIFIQAIENLSGSMHTFSCFNSVDFFYRFTDCLTCNVPTSSSSDRMNVDSNFEFISSLSLWLQQFYYRGDDDERKRPPSITFKFHLKRKILSTSCFMNIEKIFMLNFLRIPSRRKREEIFLLPGSFSKNELSYDFLFKGCVDRIPRKKSTC